MESYNTNKILYGHPGLIGDLFLNLPSIKYLNKTFGYDIDMPVHKKYLDVIPLLYNLDYLNSTIVLDGYDNFPSEKDIKLLKGKIYDKVFNPMQQHLDYWFDKRHQASTVLFDYFGGKMQLSLDQCQIELNQWFDIPTNLPGNLNNFLFKDCISFAPYAGFYNPKNDKKLSEKRAQRICDFIGVKEFNCLQIGGPDEPKLNGAIKLNTTFFESIKNILGCKFFIHTDTGSGWAISGYKFPQLGLYSSDRYTKEHIKHIQPVNPNGVYLDGPNVNDIPDEVIFAQIEEMIKNT